MTEMGANKSCSDDSGRSNIDATVENTITRLSKDRLFYHFLVDSLNAGNICQAANDTSNVTFPSDDCYQYMKFKRHCESEYTYETPRTDSDRVRYSDCLHYRLLKNLGDDDSVCKN